MKAFIAAILFAFSLSAIAAPITSDEPEVIFVLPKGTEIPKDDNYEITDDEYFSKWGPEMRNAMMISYRNGMSLLMSGQTAVDNPVEVILKDLDQFQLCTVHNIMKTAAYNGIQLFEMNPEENLIEIDVFVAHHRMMTKAIIAEKFRTEEQLATRKNEFGPAATTELLDMVKAAVGEDKDLASKAVTGLQQMNQLCAQTFIKATLIEQIAIQHYMAPPSISGN